MFIQRSYRAFTLIELMTVIGIIAILASVGIMQYSKARENARLASCKNNITHLGNALRVYADNHDGEYPNLSNENFCKKIKDGSIDIGIRAYGDNMRCPNDETDSAISYYFEFSNDPQSFTISCGDGSTNRHKNCGIASGYPKFSSSDGLMKDKELK